MVNELVLQHRMYETISACCGNTVFISLFVVILLNLIGEVKEQTMHIINICAGCFVIILTIVCIITTGIAASYPTEADVTSSVKEQK